MRHPIIFFREAEYELIKKNYNIKKQSIDIATENYFSDVSSVNQLYVKVSNLGNHATIKKELENLRESIEDPKIFNTHYKQYVDPFSYSPASISRSFDATKSKEGFYIGIILLFVYVYVSIKKWKIKKVIGFLLLISIGINLYNYYIVEHEFLSNKSFYIDEIEYNNERNLKEASEKFIALYKPKPKHLKVSQRYKYRVEGTDEMGNEVEGYIETSGKYGYGYIYNEENKEIEIDVEWVGNGVLYAKDNQNNDYDLNKTLKNNSN